MARYNKLKVQREEIKKQELKSPITSDSHSHKHNHLKKPLDSKINLDSPDKVKTPDKVKAPYIPPEPTTLKLKEASIVFGTQPVPKDYQPPVSLPDLPKAGARGPITIRPCGYIPPYPGGGMFGSLSAPMPPNSAGTPWNWHFLNFAGYNTTPPYEPQPTGTWWQSPGVYGYFHPYNRMNHPLAYKFMGDALWSAISGGFPAGALPPNYSISGNNPTITLPNDWHFLIEGWGWDSNITPQQSVASQFAHPNEPGMFNLFQGAQLSPPPTPGSPIPAYGQNLTMSLKTPAVGDRFYFNLEQSFCDPFGIQYGPPAQADLSPSMYSDPGLFFPQYVIPGWSPTWDMLRIDNATPMTTIYPPGYNFPTGLRWKLFFDWCWDGRWPYQLPDGTITGQGLPPNSHSPPIPWEIVGIGEDIEAAVTHPASQISTVHTTQTTWSPFPGLVLEGEPNKVLIVNSTNKIELGAPPPFMIPDLHDYLAANNITLDSMYAGCYGPDGGPLGRFNTGPHYPSLFQGTCPFDPVTGYSSCTSWPYWQVT